VWLLCPGDDGQLDASLTAFAACAFDLVLAPCGGSAERWARAFAGADDERFVPLALEEPASPAEAASSTWSALRASLGRERARVLAVLPADLLTGVMALALGFPPTRASAVRIDAGHAVLLRDDPMGIVLRHSNVPGPARFSGTALPGGTGAAS
jgi:hypothetical protein